MNTAVDTLERMLADRDRTTTALSISIFLRGLSDHRDVIAYLEKKRTTSDKDPYPSVFLIQILCWMGDELKAEAVAKDTIQRFAGITYEALMDKIGSAVPEMRIVRSRFVSYPNSTMQNMGFFEHRVEDRRSGAAGTLITKMTTREYSGTEIDFYQVMLEHPETLREIAPPVIDVTASSASPLCFLTMEKVPGSELVVQEMSEEDVDVFLRTYSALDAIDHRKLPQRFLEEGFEIGHSHVYLVAAMRRIHERSYFDRINNWLLESVRTRGYSESVTAMVSAMVHRLEKERFLERIDPGIHFGLLHGDLHRFNVLQHEHTFKIIDWGKCTVGPKGADLAVLFRRFPFTRTVNILERNGIWDRYDEVNRILLSYALVLVSVMIDIENIKEEPDEQLFRPATDFITASLVR